MEKRKVLSFDEAIELIQVGGYDFEFRSRTNGAIYRAWRFDGDTNTRIELVAEPKKSIPLVTQDYFMWGIRGETEQNVGD